jgi:hypothetical protein
MKNDSTRYQQLMALADEGDENAMAELFNAFDYTHAQMAK